MNVKIGLIGRSHGWEQLLLQEGVPWGGSPTVPEDTGEFSALVVTRPSDVAERRSLERYLAGGGAILGYARHLDGVAGTSVRAARLEFLTSDRRGLFSEITLLDVELDGYIPREASLLRTQHGEFSAAAGPLGGGAAVLLPFDPGALLLDERAAPKSFHAGRERLPSERVSVVSKGELRHVVHRSLEYLHHVRGRHYGHLWWYPDATRNVVALRIDTDGARRSEIDELYGIARETGVGMTWFVDVRSHEDLLPHLVSMIGQEFGVHCYHHREYAGHSDAMPDLRRARDILRAVGLHAAGVAAPFGLWSTGLAEAQEELGFAYASEFSYAYDTLPFMPGTAARPCGALQVPVHPICPGSLRQVAYAEAEMTGYFAEISDAKLLRRDPLFFYHHPGHHAWGVVRSVLRHALEAGCRPVTLGEYAGWWSRRADVRIALAFEGDRLHAHGDGAGEFWLRLSDPEGREVFVRPEREVPLAGLEWTVVPAYVPPPDIRRIREFDPRALLGRIYAAMTRRIP